MKKCMFFGTSILSGFWEGPGGLRGRFWRGLVAFRASWVALGRSWGAPGRFGLPLGGFLGVSWALLGASWLPNASQGLPGIDFGRFRERPGRFSEVPWLYFSTFFVTFRYNACNSALTALLDFPTLALLFFWCGGLCAAHPPPPEGRAVRAG